MTQTVLYGALESDVGGAVADRDRLWIPLDELERSTGWTAKPEGLCRDDVCVPVPAGKDWLDGAARRFDVAAFARHLGHAVARDEDRGVWAFGPAAAGEAASGSGPVTAPDFRLPD